MKKSVGFKLTVIILCIILAGIVITFGLSVIISGNAITKESLSKVNASTKFEAERLDRWLSEQTAPLNTLAAIISQDDELAGILTADQTNASEILELQLLDTLRPTLKALLDDNAAFFETYMGFLDGSALTGSGYTFNYKVWTSYERGWYKLALTDPSRAHITAPYVDAQTGELCISAVRAVYNNGKLLGVLGSDVFVTELLNITLNATLDSTGYSMLIGDSGDILVHHDAAFAPTSDGDFRNLRTVKDGAYAALWAKVPSMKGAEKFSDENGKAHYFAATSLSTTGWYMIAALPAQIVSQPIDRLILISIPVAIAIILIAAFIVYLTIKNTVTKPLAPLTAFMNKAGTTGDITLDAKELSVIDKFTGSHDEISQSITAALAFVERISAVSKVLETIASDDLTVELAPLSEKDTLGISLQKMVDQMNSIFYEIRQSTVQVSAGSKQISDGAQMLAQGTTQQAASIEELSSSISDIARKTRDNAEKADRAARLADTIMANAEKGNHQMDEMMAAVKEINQASQSISKVIKVIDDIAFQTNILALNAAVEAARAGQHGKGFAVVAEEVRNLASKSAEAAKETGIMIQNSIGKADLGTQIASETASSLQEIVTGINESNMIINDIAKSSEEQSSEIAQINVGIDQVTQVVQQNSATAEESAAASEEMSGQSDVLDQLIAHFKLKDGIPGISAPAKSPQKYIGSHSSHSGGFKSNTSGFGKY